MTATKHEKAMLCFVIKKQLRSPNAKTRKISIRVQGHVHQRTWRAKWLPRRHRQSNSMARTRAVMVAWYEKTAARYSRNDTETQTRRVRPWQMDWSKLTKQQKNRLKRHVCWMCEQRLDRNSCSGIYERCPQDVMDKRAIDCLQHSRKPEIANTMNVEWGPRRLIWTDTAN